jgi:hypothetical protein
MECNDAASPTVMTESILITTTIDAKQKHDVMTTDIPNAFVQTQEESSQGRVHHYKDLRTSCGYVTQNCTQSL